MEEPPGYEEEEYEDGIDGFGAQKEYKTPKLDKESQAKLLSCMDQFRSILGDNCDEEEATAAILKHDFDLERAIDDVLNKGIPCSVYSTFWENITECDIIVLP
jgi:elongation factor 1 alpha-like protein